MRCMSWALICAALVLCEPAGAQIYKCPDPAGRTVIQQMPCAGGTVMNIQRGDAERNDEGDAALASQARVAEMNHRADVRAAINTRRPMVSMTSAELRQAMGQPTRINQANYRGSLQDQWIYERDDGTWYVYTRDGIVTSIQHDDVIAHPRVVCPSEFELRNAKVSASSGTASKADLLQYRALLDQQRDCRTR